VHADGKRHAGVARNEFPKLDSGIFFALEETKNLRGLAVKSFAPRDVFRNRLLPPIAFDAPLGGDVAHGLRNRNRDQRAWVHPIKRTTFLIEIRRAVKSRIDAASRDKLRARADFGDLAVF